MAGTNNAASDRPPALQQGRGDEGGSTSIEDADATEDADASTSLRVVDAVANAFREANAAHLERVRRALATKLTPEVVEDVQRFAERRASMVRDTGRPCPRLKDYARELLQDACTDTWLGDLAWDPDACSIAAHLKLAIKARTRTEIVKALRYVSIDAAANDNDDRSSSIAVIDPFASSGDLSTMRARALVAKMCDELEEATRPDADCLAVLRAR